MCREVTLVVATVFLSHSHADKEFARPLAARLYAEGVDVWVDEAQMPPGESLLARISAAISQVDYVVACLSQTSVRSEWVTRELLLAATREIRDKRVIVLPLMLHGCRDEDIPDFLIDKCYADFRDPARYEAELHKLLLRLRGGRDPSSHIFDISDILKIFHVIDAEAKSCLTEIAAAPRRRADLVDYLVEELTRRPDPTERYWISIALGEIGGEKARRALEQARRDENPFVAHGAQTALDTLTKKDRPPPEQRHSTLLILIVLLGLVLCIAVLWRLGRNDEPQGTDRFAPKAVVMGDATDLMITVCGTRVTVTARRAGRSLFSLEMPLEVARPADN